MVIILQQPVFGQIKSQLRSIRDIIKIINENDQDEYCFDFRNISFVAPTYILSLSAIIDTLRSGGKSISLINISNSGLKLYLDTIHFPDGFKPDEIENWETQLNRFNGKNYIPIVNFSTAQSLSETTLRNDIISCVNRVIKNSCNLETNIYSGISYLISEITDNVIEHSGINRGWLSAQYYPNMEYIDICILDTGVGILQSYRSNGFYQVTNHQEAIENAINGLSTKYGEIDRGYGLWTSKKIALNGLNGSFLLMSGNRVHFNKIFYNFIENWQGTLVSMRILNNVTDFNVINYIE